VNSAILSIFVSEESILFLFKDALLIEDESEDSESRTDSKNETTGIYIVNLPAPFPPSSSRNYSFDNRRTRYLPSLCSGL
jgi:hypothetical protein